MFQALLTAAEDAKAARESQSADIRAMLEMQVGGVAQRRPCRGLDYAYADMQSDRLEGVGDAAAGVVVCNGVMGMRRLSRRSPVPACHLAVHPVLPAV